MISFTYDAISEVVMARGALRHVLHGARPAVLTRDHQAALRRTIESAFSAICVGLIPFVEECDATDTGLTLTLTSGAEERTARPFIEAALEAYTLYLAYSGVDEDFATNCRDEFRTLIEGVRGLFGGRPARGVEPCWY